MPLRILILDDEKKENELYSSLFSRRYRMQMVTSNEEANQVMQESLEKQKPFQLLLVHEKGIQNNSEVINFFQKFFQNYPVLLLANSCKPSEIIEMHDKNIHVLLEPVSEEKLHEKLEKLKEEIQKKEKEHLSLVSSEKTILFVKYVSVVMNLDNDLENVPYVIQYILDFLEKNLVSEDHLFRIKLGLTELLINAIAHGNLEVSSEDYKSKEKDFAKWNSEIKARSSNPMYLNRKVHVEINCLPAQEVTIIIEDDGNGFNVEGFFAKSVPEENFASFGRGLQMVKAMCDDLSFNEKGNQTSLRYIIRT